jgi:hypothetical protein
MVNSWKDLTAEQYVQLMDLTDNNEIVKIVYGKDIKDIPLSQLKPENLEFLKSDPKKTDIRFYTHKGKRYGMVQFDNMSLGEYIDLTSLAENWKDNIWKIMAIIYRPIVGLSLKHKLRFTLGKIVYGVGIFAKHKWWLDKGSAMLMNLDYKIAKYSDNDMNRADIYKSMPADQFHSFVLFFSLLYLRKMTDILKSSIPEKKTKTKKA